MTRPPCIVCGARPHDREYHRRWRERLRRWKDHLEHRYPALRGAPTLVTPSAFRASGPPKKVGNTGGHVRRRALVRGSETEEARRGFRPRGWRSATERLPGTLAWANRQRKLATEAPLLEFGRAFRDGAA